MSPFLFPILLILFSEFSKDKGTRDASRWFLIGYSLSLMCSMWLPPLSLTFIPVCSCLVISYLVIGCKIKLLRVRLLLLVLASLQIMNYTSLYYIDYTWYYKIPFYFEYSNTILRETTIACIALCNVDKTIDKKLRISVFIAYLIEYAYLLGF